MPIEHTLPRAGVFFFFLNKPCRIIYCIDIVHYDIRDLNDDIHALWMFGIPIIFIYHNCVLPSVIGFCNGLYKK